MEKGTDSFVAIAVMGMTGAGKSTFIQKASGLDSVKVGHDLESCTAKPEDFRFRYGSTTVVLIDTPGFDDTHRSDGDVLSDIGFFLASTYKNGVRLSGIIYLHDITKNRMTHGGLSNLIMFQDLCGPEPLGNVVLATSRWSKDPEQIQDEERFERELITNPKYWGEMVKNESKVTRFRNTTESAHEILDMLVPKEKITLAIQEEMVKENLPIGETTAGKTLNKALVDLRKELEEQMEKQIQAAMLSQNEGMKIYREEQAKKYEQKVLKLREQQERLNADDRARRREFDQMMDQIAKAKVEKEQKEVEGLETEIQALKSQRGLDTSSPDSKSEADSEAGPKANQAALAELILKKEASKRKKEKWIALIGAGISTALAGGLSVINPASIPVAVMSGIDVFRAIHAFFRKEEENS